MSHTILLVQASRSAASRTYADYDTVALAIEGLCSMFENHLKQCFPQKPEITYEITELYQFIDSLGDVSCLVFKAGANVYVPHDKEWLKKQALQMLKKQLS